MMLILVSWVSFTSSFIWNSKKNNEGSSGAMNLGSFIERILKSKNDACSIGERKPYNAVLK